MKLLENLKKENIVIADSYEDTDDFYLNYSKFLKQREIVKDSETIKRLFIRRENVHSTAIKKGAATPHIYSEEFSEFTFSVVLIKEGLDFKAPDEGKVFLVFLIMSNEREVSRHLKALAYIAHLVNDTDLLTAAKGAGSVDELYNILMEKGGLLNN